MREELTTERLPDSSAGDAVENDSFVKFCQERSVYASAARQHIDDQCLKGLLTASLWSLSQAAHGQARKQDEGSHAA